MDAIAKMDNLSSAAAFVEGGIQDAFDDACSICLEPFCDSNPSTVTGCKHEFHLQCILEWCQRSSQCPMCLQPISLKDTDSQELLEVVERERIIRANQTRSTAIFHHPALGDFEFQHLPIDTTDSELEERIIHHLAAAAAMGRAHHNARREVQRVRAAAHGRPQLLVLSSTPNATLGASDSISSPQRIENELPAAVPVASPSAVMTPVAVASQVLGASQGLGIEISPAVGIASNSGSGPSSNRVSVGQPSPVSQDRAGPSDFHSFSESLKSRLNAVSMRYKDSISKSTRGWKERLFSRTHPCQRLVLRSGGKSVLGLPQCLA
ncbi:hypothetical protein HPP92_012830 [Vanilla planifolia]|uniref:RING-type E3 ubiquitin transferase n=1 Tax=Vanilla planifolia TaxID=51239 RepID=A0A835QVX6_VANPL|nr:hypothetical protein HPP92_013300 [Vanilla planifolia]KAG0478111.1 hypothetical protein HPP92_012830 [Vanilla planifolia]